MLSVLLCLATTPLTFLAAPQDPAALVPADTLIYFGTDSIKASSVAARKTAMSRIFAESEVRGFLHEPVSAAEGVFKALMGQAMAEAGGVGGLEEMLGEDFEISLYPSPDDEPLPIGRAMFALTHLELPSGQPGSPVLPDVGLVVGMELLDSEHVGMVKALWEQIPFPADSSMHAGVTVHEKSMGPGTPTLSLAFVDDLAVMSLSPRSLQGVIDRAQGTQSDSLAGSSDYSALLAAGGGAGKGMTTTIVRFPELASLSRLAMTMGLGQAAMSGEMDQTMVGTIMNLYDGLGLDAIQLMGGFSKIGDDGRIHTTNVAKLDPTRSGLIASMAAGGNTISTSLLSEVPADALSASAMGLGDEFVQFYDFVMGAAKTMAPEEVAEAEGMVGMILGGKSLRDDVLGNMSDHVVSMSVPGVGFPGTPNQILRVGMKNPEAFVEAMESLIGFASAQLKEQAGFPVSLKTTEHEGVAFYEIDLSQTPLAAAGMSPAFAVRNGEVVMTDSAPRLRGFLDGGMSEGPKLVDHERFSAFTKGLSDNGELINISYSDTAANFSTMYTQVSAVVPMLAMTGVQMPVDFSKLPREQSISQHLDISLMGSYRTADGTYITRSESSMSMLDLLPLVEVGALLAIGAEMGIEAEAEPMEVDPSQVAADDLRELKASLTIYKISTGAYPTDLAELIVPLDDFPQGTFPGGALPMDPWGHPYRFAMEANPSRGGRISPKLWSVGENGVDESGEGDDILKF